MAAPDPWTFGWSQVLTIIGFLITICIALGGFRTFGRWKREKIEEKRMDVAIEALSVAYQTKFVFDGIRNAFAGGYEWKDMPRQAGESDDEWNHRGTFYAILKRIDNNRDFFQKVWTLQPRFMAMYGPKTEEIFLQLYEARRFIETSARMLAGKNAANEERTEQREKRHNQMEADIWDLADAHGVPDRVGTRLADFRTKIETLCRPLLASSSTGAG